MKRNKLFSLLLALCLLCSLSTAVAENATPGDLPQFGLLLPMTRQDLDTGLELMPYLMPGDMQLPVMDIIFHDRAAQEQVLAAYPEEQRQNADVYEEFMNAFYAHTYLVGRVFLIQNPIWESWAQLGETPASLTGQESAWLVGENDGFTYLAVSLEGANTVDDPALQQQLTTAEARAAQLLKELTLQPIQFAESASAGDGTPFPTFTTTDLEGNTVTDALFADNKLTVVRVWGTYCGPCIEDLEKLGEWNQTLPEGVQLVGLVSDLYSATDTATLDTAKTITEATGSHTFPHLVVSADFATLMSSIPGVPTTFFVDSNGMLVGEPVVGANAPACISFVEEYLNAQ